MSQDKRDAYRISEEALLNVVTLPQEADLGRSVELHFPGSQLGARAEVRARLNSLDKGYRECHARLARLDPVAAEACNWLAAQIEALRDVVLDGEGTVAGARRQMVSISANGLGFEHPVPMETGVHVALHLVLLPQNEPVLSYGVVRQCRVSAAGYFVGIEFVDLGAEYQRRLNRHMLKAQITGKSASGDAARRGDPSAKPERGL